MVEEANFLYLPDGYEITGSLGSPDGWSNLLGDVEPKKVHSILTRGLQINSLELNGGRVSYSIAMEGSSEGYPISMEVKNIYSDLAVQVSIELGKDLHRKGFSKKLMSNLVDLLEITGRDAIISEVASFGYQNYVWNKYGFLPSDDNHQARVFDKLEDNKGDLEFMEDEGQIKIPQEFKELLDNVLSSRDPKGIWEIADHGVIIAKDGEDLHLGRMMLNVDILGPEVRLDLRDADSMKRFNSYTGRVNKAQLLAQEKRPLGSGEVEI